MSLTRPEFVTERRQTRALLKRIMDCGGCRYCVHSQLAWGENYCPTDASREFPNCTTDGREPSFSLDEGMK